MKKSFGPYRRLARGCLGGSSLWVGDGQLLYVRGHGVLLPFSEDYLRFDLASLQGVSVMRTYTGLIFNIIWIACTLSFGAFGVFLIDRILRSAEFWSSGERTASLTLASIPLVIALTFLGLLVANVWLGPTCHCLIQSPVRSERLRPLRRLKTVRRVLAELVSLIDMVQQTPVQPAAQNEESNVAADPHRIPPSASPAADSAFPVS